MSRHSPRHASRGAHPSRRVVHGLAAVVAIVLLVVAALTAGGAGTVGDVAVATRSEPREEADSGVAQAATGRRTGAVTPEPPRRVVLPSGREVSVLSVGTTSDGTLDVPDDVNVSGWWRGGSRIGDPFGSTLLSAHVDSTRQGLGPYAELLTVRPGGSIVLTSENLRQEYVVRSLRLLDKGPLSANPRVYSATGPHRLTMVTCAGRFIESRGGYQRLAVVTATPVGPPTVRGT